jgi:protein-S-isoprenylcysteine O-methyltransferase Ste14
MIAFLRHLLAILALPVVMTILVPRWIGVTFTWPQGAQAVVAFAAGVIALAIGVLLFVASVYEFATRGRGTLAPWDPPKHLVVHGPYRFVRNPMISGVIFILIGEALILRSVAHGWWAAAFVLINAIYIPLFEEPQLEERFGDSYREYRRHVRRFLPRLRPWSLNGASRQ